MVFDSGGVLRDDGGSELARVESVPDPGFARLTMGSESYAIQPKGARSWHLELLDPASGLLYEFRPGLRRGGTLRSARGDELAQVHKRLLGRNWTIVPAGGDPIGVRRRPLIGGPVVAEHGFAAPEFEVSVPLGAPSADRDFRRLLAFTCWVIAGWETERPGGIG